MRKHHANLLELIVAGIFAGCVISPGPFGFLLCVVGYAVWFRLRRAELRRVVKNDL